MEEQWKTHTRYTKYEVSNLGNIRHTAHTHVYVKPVHRGPHYAVVLGIHTPTLRQVVAEVWVPNETGHANVRHKNGDAHDNRAENLEWYSKSCRGGRKKYNAEGITVTASSDMSWEDRLSEVTFSTPTPSRTVMKDRDTGEWVVQYTRIAQFDN
jgi:hypothetical protein